MAMATLDADRQRFNPGNDASQLMLRRGMQQVHNSRLLRQAFRQQARAGCPGRSASVLRNGAARYGRDTARAFNAAALHSPRASVHPLPHPGGSSSDFPTELLLSDLNFLL